MPPGSHVSLKVETRKAVERDAYTGVFRLSEISEAFPGASRIVVAAKLKELPSGLVDSETSLALTRAINRICGVQVKALEYYTSNILDT